jgi:hypothetical protein
MKTVRQLIPLLMLVSMPVWGSATIEGTMSYTKGDRVVVKVGKSELSVKKSNILFPKLNDLKPGMTVVVNLGEDDFKIKYK